jgi:hypothetical protein
LSEGGVDARSGRAIAMLRESGMAELGPFVLAHRGWKVRVYRKAWNIVQQHWQAERWIRVTDDEGLAQFIQINGLQIDPMTGQPAMVNAIGSLDVDIILDEAPDSINAMQDLYETLQQVLPAVAPMLMPAQAQAAVELLINSSPIDSSAKKKFKEAGEQPAPPNPEIAKAEADLAIKQQTAQADMAIRTATAEQDMELKTRQAQLDAAIDIDKHNREMEFKTKTASQDIEHEHVKNTMKREHEAETHNAKLEHEKSVRKTQTSDPTTENVANVTAEALNNLTDGIGKVGEAIASKLEGLEKAFLAPTKLVKDAQGRPIAAVKTNG